MKRRSLSISTCVILAGLAMINGAQAQVTPSQAISNSPGYLDLNEKTNPYIDGIPGILENLKVVHDSDKRTFSRILRDDFVDASGRFRVDQIDVYIKRVQEMEHREFIMDASQHAKVSPTDKRENLEKLWQNRNNPDTVNSSEFLIKWNKDKDRTIYKFIIGQFQKAKDLVTRSYRSQNFMERSFLNSVAAQPLMEALFQGVAGFEAKRGGSEEEVSMGNFIRVQKKSFADFEIGKNRTEALDLVDSSKDAAVHGVFLSPADIQSRIKAGQDVSMLDPIDDGLWHKPAKAIKDYDTTKYDGSTANVVGTEMLDPEAPIEVWYDRDVNSRGRTPKMIVNYRDLKFKMKFETPAKKPQAAGDITNAGEYAQQTSQESKTEHAANEMLAALGYRVDPTYFKRNVKLYMTMQEKPLKARDPERCKEYNQEFDRIKTDALKRLNTTGWMLPDAYREKRGETWWNYAAALSDVRTDEQGCKYILVKNANFELRPQNENIKIGYPIQEGLSRPFKRAFRGLILYYALINNIDVYDWNSRVELAGDKLILSPADMGQSFGGMMYANHPMSYSPHFISKVVMKDGAPVIHTTFKGTLFESPIKLDTNIFDIVTINDAKWFARMIGQLTPEQVKKAFLVSGHPEIVAEIYAQNFLNRRDELLSSLGLLTKSGPYTKLSKVTDPSHSYVDPNRPECFDGYVLKETCVKPEDNINHSYTMTANPRSMLHPDDTSNIGQVEIAAANTTSFTATQAAGSVIQNFGIKRKLGKAKLGALTLLPFRETMASPFGEEKSWVVDVYPCKMGLEFPTNKTVLKAYPTLGPDAGIFRLNYLAVVRTTDKAFSEALHSYDVYLKEDSYKDILKECGKFTGAVGQQLIEQLEPDAILVSGNSLAIGAGAQFSALSLTDRFVFQKETTRNLVIRKNNGQVQMSWMKSNDFVFNPLDVSEGTSSIFRMPVVTASMKTDHYQEKIYTYDWEKQHDVILKNIQAKSFTDGTFQLGREKKTHMVSLFASLLGLKNYLRANQKFELTTADEDGIVDHIYSSVKEKNSTTSNLWPWTFTRPVTENVLRVRAAVTTQGQPAASIEFSYSQNYANRDDLKRMQDALKMLPPTFMPLKSSEMAYRLGMLSLMGNIYISGNGLNKAFAADEATALAAMQSALKENDSNSQKALNLFAKRFHKVKLFLADLKNERKSTDPKKLNEKLTDAISSLLYIKEGGHAAVKALEYLAGEENVHREALMVSDASNFPSQRAKIELNSELQGRMAPEVLDYLKEELGLTRSRAEVVTDTVSSLLADFVNKANTVNPLAGMRFENPQRSLIRDEQHAEGQD